MYFTFELALDRIGSHPIKLRRPATIRYVRTLIHSPQLYCALILSILALCEDSRVSARILRIHCGIYLGYKRLTLSLALVAINYLG